jgi:hypothetical protein
MGGDKSKEVGSRALYAQVDNAPLTRSAAHLDVLAAADPPAEDSQKQKQSMNSQWVCCLCPAMAHCIAAHRRAQVG